MYYFSSSSLVIFFLFSLFHHLPCASSKLELHETLFRCGNITAGFPFWGGSSKKHCGHPLLELRCNNDSSNSLIILDQGYSVFHLNQTSNTLTLAKPELIGSFCSSVFTNKTLPPQIFELLPTYKNITVFYHCDPFLPYLSSYTCPEIGLTYLSENHDYHNSTCRKSFTLNVNVTNFENVLRKGFEVKVKIDKKAYQECLSSHGRSSFNETLPVELEYNPRNPPSDCSMCKDQGGVCKHDKSTFICDFVKDEGDALHGNQATGLPSGVIAVLIAFGIILVLLSGLISFSQCVKERKVTLEPGKQNHKALTIQPELIALIPLKQYSYAEVRRIAKSFTEVVGRGGFGIVYRGTLSDGRRVAVKVLKDSMGNGEDFINEVAAMSQTSHVNIVTLLGFCAEGSMRAILYEFLENGSLDKFISSKTTIKMDRMALYRIALGVARGLEYLHHGCRTRIIHFDIKPQNVLLDDYLCPKVSDFGLAKLCEKKESILSLLDTRGTIGYIAPEVFSKVYGRVSYKSDVYSYGMLVLEMLGARNNDRDAHKSSSNTSSIYFPEWIYKDLEKGDSGRLNLDEINIEEEEIAKKMTLVGLWCIQPSPSNRPPMNRVVEMMEGSVDALEVPRRPALQIPSAPLQDSSTLSGHTVEMMEGSVDALEVPPRPALRIPSAPLQESSTLSGDTSVYTEYDP